MGYSMTLGQYLQMEKLIHGREIPADILYQMTSDHPDENYQHFSESKGTLMSIFDMNLHHFIRAYAKVNSHGQNEMHEQLSEIKKILEVA